MLSLSQMQEAHYNIRDLTSLLNAYIENNGKGKVSGYFAGQTFSIGGNSTGVITECQQKAIVYIINNYNLEIRQLKALLRAFIPEKQDSNMLKCALEFGKKIANKCFNKSDEGIQEQIQDLIQEQEKVKANNKISNGPIMSRKVEKQLDELLYEEDAITDKEEPEDDYNNSTLDPDWKG